jgi:ATP/maltotriose-dependent transcriptional regulator MalT
LSAAAVELEFLESKLRPPWRRAGLVARTSLVDQLLASEPPVIAVVAPPGYGKTTLLSQLHERSPQRTAWVSLERLVVTRNTVKSEAISIYRKLGVSARGEAIRRAEEIGLLSR